MTAASALTPQRARDLGRGLAHRLLPVPQEPAQLAGAASLALLSLLPTWLPPGEERTAIALRQLVRDERFSAYLLASLAVEGAHASETALRRHLEQTFAEPLQPLLLLFCEGCREAMRDHLPGSRSQAVPAPAAAGDPPGAEASPGGISGMASFSLAALACVAMGWLGYQAVASLRPADPTPGATDLLSPSPAAGAAGQAAAGAAVSGGPPPSATPLRDGGMSTVVQRASLTALQCLAAGQTETAVPADPSNYGPRLAQDWQGRSVPHLPGLIVLHETVVEEAAALNLFRRRQGDDARQASYHVLIGRDGRRIRVVDDTQRAFGAGDSAFEGQSVQLKAGLRPSINNVALHVSLVSPGDGADGEAQRHSGYTAEQYRSLASQIAQWQARWAIPASRVVTHQEVDRSGSRRDPRSFDWQALGRDLQQRWLACGGTAQLADLGR